MDDLDEYQTMKTSSAGEITKFRQTHSVDRKRKLPQSNATTSLSIKSEVFLPFHTGG